MPLKYVGNYEQRMSKWFEVAEEINEIKRGHKNVYISSTKEDKGIIVKIKEWAKSKFKKRKFYIIPSPPDDRDYELDYSYRFSYKDLPRKKINHPPPWVLDQEDTPFCGGASAAASGNAFYDRIYKLPYNGFSMSFLYWLSKMYDGVPDEEGTYLRTINKVMQKYGLCREILAPFSEMKSKSIITKEMIEDAKPYKIDSYIKLVTLGEIKAALANGYYILIGTLITSRNWDTTDGFLGLPSGYILGGHATMLYGYNDDLKHGDHKGYLYGINSWSDRWGDEGRFYMPYDYYHWESDKVPGFFAFFEAWAIKFQPNEINPPNNENDNGQNNNDNSNDENNHDDGNNHNNNNNCDCDCNKDECCVPKCPRTFKIALRCLFSSIINPFKVGRYSIMEEKPWFATIEFWTALVTALAIFLSAQFGIELEITHVVGIIVALVAFFWKKSKDDEKVASYKMLEKEIQLERIRASR